MTCRLGGKLYLDLAPLPSAELMQMTRGYDAGKAILRLAPLFDAEANTMMFSLAARSMAFSMLWYHRRKPKDIVIMSTPPSYAARIIAWIDC